MSIEFKSMEELRTFYNDQMRLLNLQNCKTAAENLRDSKFLSNFTWTSQSTGCYDEINLKVLTSSLVTDDQYDDYVKLVKGKREFTFDGNIYFSVELQDAHFFLRIGIFPGELDLEVADVRSVILGLGITVNFQNQISGIQRRLKEIDNIKRMCLKALEVYGVDVVTVPEFATES